jgi:hypothetical protein
MHCPRRSTDLWTAPTKNGPYVLRWKRKISRHTCLARSWCRYSLLVSTLSLNRMYGRDCRILAQRTRKLYMRRFGRYPNQKGSSKITASGDWFTQSKSCDSWLRVELFGGEVGGPHSMFFVPSLTAFAVNVRPTRGSESITASTHRETILHTKHYLDIHTLS